MRSRLNSHSFLSTNIELGWLPRNWGNSADKSSSRIRFPRVGFVWLIVSNRYSGMCFKGDSKIWRTCWYWADSDRWINISTTSIDNQTSSISCVTFSLLRPWSSLMTDYLRAVFANGMLLSFFWTYRLILCSIKLTCREGLTQYLSSMAGKRIYKFWGLLLLKICSRIMNDFWVKVTDCSISPKASNTFDQLRLE